MKRQFGKALAIILIWLACSGACLAQVSGSVPDEAITPGEVVIEGRPIVTVYESIGNLTPEERANAIRGRILAIARDPQISSDCLTLVQRESWTEIDCAKTLVMAVTELDSRKAGKPRERLAAEALENIRRELQTYRREHSWRVLLKGLLQTLIATMVLIPSLWMVFRLRRLIRRRIEIHAAQEASTEGGSTWRKFLRYFLHALLTLGRLMKWFVILALLDGYFTITLSFFSSTREISVRATQWVLQQLSTLAKAALDYLPNLLVVAVVGICCYYVLQIIRLIFDEIRRGALRLEGFYPEWAEPTEKLIRVLILALATVIAFPYLPGAKSPAFQGISIFLGVLLSLGSSSAVANAIAGIILTYMRSYSIGDWVQIADTTGEVVERNLLVTRVLTPKAEIITIPNSTVMSGSVKNYSTESKKGGVIFHTTVTIGYDAPWRKVHQLLLNAARSTNHVLEDPAPFVLQLALDDFYVSYELNAYTDTPKKMLEVYSVLHQNIQDKFNEAGVEICSPHFASLRDGNAIAVPEQYVTAEHDAHAFQVEIKQAKSATFGSSR